MGLTIEMDAASYKRILSIKISALPPGVHYLSPESEAILKRAAERDAALSARHIKKEIQS